MGERKRRRTLTTRELALLCSYARSALLTSGMLCTRESVFHSSLSPRGLAEEGEEEEAAVAAASALLRSSRSSSRKSSSIKEGEGREGEEDADVIESAGVVWNAAARRRRLAGEIYQSVGVGKPKLAHTCRGRGGVLCAVAHVSQGADGDADGLVLVCEGHGGGAVEMRGDGVGRRGWRRGIGKRGETRGRAGRWGCEKHMNSTHTTRPLSRASPGHSNLIEPPVAVPHRLPLPKPRAPELVPNEQPPPEVELVHPSAEHNMGERP